MRVGPDAAALRVAAEVKLDLLVHHAGCQSIAGIAQ